MIGADMEQKKWYVSKLVGLGVLQTLIGISTLVTEYLKSGDYSPVAVSILVTGIMVVVSRVWFTSATIVA